MSINRNRPASDKVVNHAVTIQLVGLELTVLPRVFNPALHECCPFFADQMVSQECSGHMIEIGAGSGIVGLSTLVRCKLNQLTATDIRRHAVDNVRLNSRKLGVADRVSCHAGSVYAALPHDHQLADCIFWNTPWGYLSPMRTRMPDWKYHYYDPGYRHIDAYIGGAPQHLKRSGRLFLGFGMTGQEKKLHQIALRHGYEIQLRGFRAYVKSQKPVHMFYELVRPTRNVFQVTAPLTSLPAVA